MSTFLISFISVMILGVINLPFRYYFDEKTMYKKSELVDQHFMFVVSFILFGLIMLLFIKQIKEYRKYIYIKKTVSDYERWERYWIERKAYGPIPENIDISDEVYFNYKRYLKLKKLKRKI